MQEILLSLRGPKAAESGSGCGEEEMDIVVWEHASPALTASLVPVEFMSLPLLGIAQEDQPSNAVLAGSSLSQELVRQG